MQGKQPFHDRPVKKRLSLPESLCDAVDAQLLDPFKQKPKYGGWSGLCATLLRKWLAEQGAPPVPVNPLENLDV